MPPSSPGRFLVFTAEEKSLIALIKARLIAEMPAEPVEDLIPWMNRAMQIYQEEVQADDGVQATQLPQ